MVAAALLPALVLWVFVAAVDPWGMLPVHLPISRVPISTNARFSFPALAISKRFDAVVIGTSTARLLRPAVLDGIFGGARFANLAMNAATAWEQGRMLALFARHHRQARAVVLDLDASWCEALPGSPALTGRAFPAWMYGGSPWRGYARMLDLYALQEAANQMAVVAGLKHGTYGRDGYTDFLPPDRDYDPARVAALFRRWGVPNDVKAPSGTIRLPYVEALPTLLSRLPPHAAKMLFMPPITVEQLGRPGSVTRAEWDRCEVAAAAAVRRVPDAILLDFAIPNAITRDHGAFWDPIHYRVAVADRIMAGMADALDGKTKPGNGLFRVLARGPRA